MLPRFATGTYAVTRRSGVSFSAGRLVPGSGTVETLQVLACVQPLGGRDLLRFPEGERSTERLVFFAAVPLRVAGPSGEGDVVTIDGVGWEVENVEDWTPFGGSARATLRRTGR